MKYVLCLLIALIGFNLNAAETKLAPETAVQQNVEQALLTSAEKAILERLNAERTARGLQVVVVDHGLMARARAHAAWMATNRIMRHSPGAWENIAAGQSTPIAAMNTWMNSSGHRANMLSYNVRRIGIGTYGTYYCQQFASAPTAAPAKKAETQKCEGDACKVQQGGNCANGACGTQSYGGPVKKFLGRLRNLRG